jgi:hypothetical protein
LGTQLGDCTLIGEAPGIEAPNYGYQFKDNKNGEYVAVLWNGESEKLGTFTTTADKVELVDLFGKSRKILLGKNKQFSLAYGASAVFIRSGAPVSLVSTKDMKKKTGTSSEDAEVSLKMKKLNIIIRDNVDTTNVAIDLANDTGETINGSVTVRTINDKILGSKDISIAALSDSTDDIKIDLSFPENTALVSYKLYFNYIVDGASFSEEKLFTVRRLTAVPNGVTTVKTHFQNYENDIYILANDKIEASFDPAHGGRILELIDKKTLTNQVRIDYDLVPSLPSIVYNYAIWFQLDGKMKNSPFKISSTENGELKLSAENIKGKFNADMLWSVNKDDSTLSLKVIVKNKTSNQEKFKFYMHPEYNLAGQAKSGVDIFLFPTDSGVFKLPFWVDLGERKIPQLTEDWWAVFDNESDLELKQRFSEGWSTPRVWFGAGCYNVEMTKIFELAPNAESKALISWSLDKIK